MLKVGINTQRLDAILNGEEKPTEPVGYAISPSGKQKFTLFLATDKDTQEARFDKKGQLLFNLKQQTEQQIGD